MERILDVGYRAYHKKFGWYVVVAKVNNQKYTVRFDATGFEYDASKYHILDNFVLDKRSEYFHQIGETYKHPVYGEYKIVEILKGRKAVIEFTQTKYRYTTSTNNAIKGVVKDIFLPTIFGFGYVGSNKSRITKQKSYSTWHNMLKRCYDSDFLKKRTTYKGCSVCEEWHCFATFQEWFDEHHKDGWHLDKDILVKGNKVYSPNTCCFVPNEINTLFTKRQNYRGKTPIGVVYCKPQRCFKECYKATITRGKGSKYIGTFATPVDAFNAYKREKEKWIKEVADKWKDQLEPRVYKALYNYKVEITD